MSKLQFLEWSEENGIGIEEAEWLWCLLQQFQPLNERDAELAYSIYIRTLLAKEAAWLQFS